MAKKEEQIECSDTWLSYWANPQGRIKQENDNFFVHNMKNVFGEVSMKEGQTSKFLIKSESSKPSKGDLVNHESEFKERKNLKERKQNTKQKKVSDCKKPIWKDALEHAPVSNTVASLCRYKCKECGKIYQARFSLGKHLRQANHAIVGRGCINDYLIKIVSHKCQICFRKVLCDVTTIKEHLRNCHKLKSLNE